MPKQEPTLSHSFAHGPTGTPRARPLPTGQLNVRSQVVFAGKQKNIADYLQVMDVYCLPSASDESFGNGVVEAMAMSLPSIIFSDGGGMVEHIQDCETGFIVTDQSDLEKTLLKLVDNPDFAGQVGERAALSVRQKYNRQRAAAQFRKSCRRLLQCRTMTVPAEKRAFV